MYNQLVAHIAQSIVEDTNVLTKEELDQKIQVDNLDKILLKEHVLDFIESNWFLEDLESNSRKIKKQLTYWF